MPLDAVIRAATSAPAKAARIPGAPGTLAEGAIADVTILALEDGDFTFTDSARQTRTARQRLTHVATIRGGDVVGAATAAAARP
jgi:dihydroorotase